MNKLTRHLLLAAIMMALGGTALAADPPKDPPKDAKDAKDSKDAKKEEAKADEPDLPSKPYPKNAVPKAFQPKKDETKEAAAKPEAAPAPAADKAAAKPAPVAAEKHAEKSVDKTIDKPMVKLPTADKLDGAHDRPVIVASPKKRKPARPAPVAAANASLPQLAHESARKTALSNEQEAYVAQSGDTLDKVIKKTFPSSPFSNDVMREAFVRANPKLVPPKNIKLKPGQLVYLPDVNVMRIVVMGEGTGPATMAVSGDVHYDKKPMMHVPASTAPAAIAPAAAVQNPPIAIPRLPVNVANNTTPAREVSPEEKKMWVRYP
ncbi:MAG: hypothetical protein EBV64_10895 [Oxalobacteraceae bacterium]|jgi:hypothetical protein|nr:hypothetical protein [Oxalobacteraceae bacterium]